MAREKQRVEFSPESGKRIAEVVRKVEHWNDGPLPTATGAKAHPQKLFRVKLQARLKDTNNVVGIRQIQKEDGNVQWTDINDAKISPIYKGSPDQADLPKNSIVWIVSHRGRWFVVGGPSIAVGKADGAIAKGTFGSVSIYDSPNNDSYTLEDTNVDAIAWARLGDVEEDGWCYLWKFGWGWEVVNTECL